MAVESSLLVSAEDWHRFNLANSFSVTDTVLSLKESKTQFHSK